MSNTVDDTLLDKVPPTYASPIALAWRFECVRTPGSLFLDAWYIYLPNRDTKLYLLVLTRLQESEVIVKNTSHMIYVVAVDTRNPIYINKMPTIILPPLRVSQWYSISDELAIQFVQTAVMDIMLGRLDPTDIELDEWVMRFGDNLVDKEGLNTSYVLTQQEIN